MQNNPEKTKQEKHCGFFDRGYIIGLIVTFIVDLIIAGLVIVYEITALKQTFESDLFVILSDAFTISGGLTCLIFLLVFISGEGAFDAIVYGVKVAFYTTFYKNIRETKIPSTYAEYRELKRGKEKKKTSFLVIIGGIFLLIGIIFLIPYTKSI